MKTSQAPFSFLTDSPSTAELQAHLEHFIPNFLQKSETLQQAFDLSSEEMEELYSDAYGFYQQESFVQAKKGFRWLVLLNPFIAKYWLGLAASLQLLEKYEKALHAYAVATLLESNNPYPHFYAYECYVALHNGCEANKALSLAWELATASWNYHELREKIELIKQELN